MSTPRRPPAAELPDPPGGVIPSASALIEALSYLHAVAATEGRHIAVVGGLAMQRLGSPRFTGDVDIVADKRIRALGDGRPLSIGGITVRVPVPSGETVQVDVIVADEMPDPDEAELYRAALGERVRDPVTGFLHVRPEDLLVMKLSAGREKDEHDVRWLLAYGKVDMDRAKRLVRRHLGRYAVKALEDTAAEAAWAHSRGKL